MIDWRVKIAVALVVLGGLAVLVLVPFPPIGYNEGHHPEQPIPFDHSLHAGKLQMQCMYCHVNADKSRHATVPHAAICMNCHKVVLPQNPDILKLKKALEQDRPIVWNRVHLLPDFVKFNHQPHIRKGVACQECHGPVEQMKTMQQHSDLSMGWCLNCHRKPEHAASVNCTTCHY